jgi:putative endonuclease
MSGLVSYLSGLAAEDQVTRAYARDGYAILSRRWRGDGGEIDLIAEKDGEIVFIEIKKRRTLWQAAHALSRHQIARIVQTAEQYLGFLPTGSLTPCRIDLALVDGQGRMELRHNALM